MPRSVAILGSTGSIGVQALDVIRRNRDRFRVTAIASGGGDVGTLAEQALEFEVEAVGVSRATAASDLQLALYAEAQRRGYAEGRFVLPRIVAGPDACTEIAGWPADVVLNGIAGAAGLAPTLAALAGGRILALANKESLIIGGPIVRALAKPGQIVPVDSEHSAIAQALRGGSGEEVRRLVITASGGPFRGWRREQLEDVTVDQALAHPTWSMGPLVTINSATLVNKGLEVIEANLLFDIPFDRIEVVVHPQSVVHSMVEFVDGSTIAQASPPDMRLPIALGLSWPDRVAHAAPACDWTSATTWEFYPLDDDAFPAVRLARRVGSVGGTAPAVFNAADEACVAAFLAGRIAFPRIVETIAKVVDEHLEGDPDAALTGSRWIDGNNVTMSDVISADAWARQRAEELAIEATEGSRA